MKLQQATLEKHLKAISKEVKALHFRKDPRVFTIFCHGTQYDRTKARGTRDESEELVTKLSGFMKHQNEAIPKGGWEKGSTALSGTHLILEGPGSEKSMRPGLVNPFFGSGSSSVTKKTAQSRIPKPPKYNSKGKKLKPDKAFRKDFYGDTTEAPVGISGSAKGTGWGDNVIKAAAVVENLFGSGAGPDVVNILGWSRGGITCLRIANKLYEVFGGSIRVNIFACDPVMGREDFVYHKGKDMWTIPPNVDHYMAVLAKDEYRYNFRCVGRDRVQLYKGFVPQTHFLLLPGTHGFVSNTSGAYGTDGSVSGSIAVDVAYKFLSYYGTKFETGTYQCLGADEIFKKYNTLMQRTRYIQDLSERKNREQSRIASGGVDRKHRNFYPESSFVATNQKCDYTSNVKLYLNYHHELAIKNRRSYSSWSKAYATGNYVDDVGIDNKAVAALKEISNMFGYRLVPGAQEIVELSRAELKALHEVQSKQTPLEKMLPNMFASGDVKH